MQKKQNRLQCVHLCVCAAACVYVCSVEIKQERKKTVCSRGTNSNWSLKEHKFPFDACVAAKKASKLNCLYQRIL